MIPTKSKGKYILWPAYFDSSKTRREGRKIHKSLTVESPQVQDIYKAAIRLGLNPVEEKNSHYPRFCWEKAGNILVDKKSKKSVLISNIAKELKVSREKDVNLGH